MSDVSLKDPNAGVTGPVRPGTYIAVTFWGEEYRRFFLDYCLASLMAPGNIPAIQNKNIARLLIATRQDDWQALQSEPIFIAAKRHIVIEHVPHEAGLNVPYNKKMMVMSQGHKLLTQRMFEDRAHGVMVYPDIIVADGAIGKIEQLAAKGYKVVLCIAVRFSNDGLVDDLKRLGFVESGKPIIISAEELARLTLKHMHSETVRLDFDAELDDHGACSFFWVVKPGENLVFHCGNWAPVLLDYSAVDTHDASTFDAWTFDGDYVARNFPNVSDIHVVQNTAELFISGFTSEAKVSYRIFRPWPYRFPSLRTIIKIVRAREYLGTLKILDDVKKVFFLVPIRVQGGVSSEAAWRETEARAATVVQQVINPTLAVTVYCYCWWVLRRCISLILRPRRWLHIYRANQREQARVRS
jgi:hypothetical protein